MSDLYMRVFRKWHIKRTSRLVILPQVLQTKLFEETCRLQTYTLIKNKSRKNILIDIIINSYSNTENTLHKK